MLLAMVQTRVEEMNRLAVEGIPPTEPVLNRLQSQIHAAFRVAAGMDAAQGETVLLRIQNALQTQQQAMLQGEGDASQMMEQTRLMLQEQLQLVDQGLEDPQGFQEMFQGGEESEPGGPEAGGQGSDVTPGGPGEPQGPGTPGGQGNGNKP
jgi:hypothetical protein